MVLPLLIVGLVAVSVAYAVSMVRAQRTISDLRAQLVDSAEAQRTKDSLLIQRSELDQIKDEFISTVSHELRTPLTSIRGALGLLSAGLMGAMDSKAQNLLRIAVTNTDRLIRLINDILDLERMESGRAPLHMRRCSFRDLIQQAMETMNPMAEANHVKLKFVMSAPPDSIYFDGDSDRMLQVLTNLLSNAVKFSPINGTVEILLDADGDSVFLRVSDQGRGIPIDKLDSIFDRFQQVEASDARQKGGTGLGLTICRSIIQQHNGSIWAESNVQHHRGPGASLYVSIPRVKRTQDSGIRSADRRIASLLAPTAQATVIVCDDDAGIRTVVGESLRQHGYNILEAETGQRAIELATGKKVDAILLDLHMPGMNGWQTMQRLKNSPATADIPVVILSVLSSSDLHTKGSPLNGRRITDSAQGWIQKPFNEHLLLSGLARVLHAGDGPPRVLLVEDDQDLASVVIAGFEEAHVNIDHASTSQSAIDQCKTTRPDLLILDLTLPDGDGFSLVDWLRSQPELRSMPLVVYSGREVSETEMAQLRLGPTQFLTKAKVQPHEVEELVLNIVHHMRETELPTLVS